ncbi:hypothetical protein FDP08_14120 [Marinobacter panjinensis]|uniref:Uncharacterized protein n=1 Tax=Marinobacter panjinensis TaxID=2576384 RepID=A0A4U6R7Z3_9GAMM|nr:hypothetical protein [Marinobacter panjinensis]TKV69148.1 hypothetical protein FDP08_14120 [Marinobacter panjinensis]
MSEVITLIAALIAVVGSIISLFISTKLAIHKERRQILWAKELERFFGLEEQAGELVEFAGGYRSLPEDRSKLGAQLDNLADSAGRFARYPEVRQAIRDLHNTLGRALDMKQGESPDREVRAELGPAYQKLLSACDEVLQRERAANA